MKKILLGLSTGLFQGIGVGLIFLIIFFTTNNSSNTSGAYENLEVIEIEVSELKLSKGDIFSKETNSKINWLTVSLRIKNDTDENFRDLDFDFEFYDKNEIFVFSNTQDYREIILPGSTDNISFNIPVPHAITPDRVQGVEAKAQYKKWR